MKQQPIENGRFPRGFGFLAASSIGFALLASAACALAMDARMALIEERITGERIPEEIPLNVVRNGEPLPNSKVKVANDGTFGFYFQPEYTGFYTVGERGGAARLFLAPGKTVQLTMDGDRFTAGADDRENTLLANWAKTLWELKKCNQLRGNYTYKEVFPTLQALEKAKDATLAGVQGGGSGFDRLFPKLVEAEFEYELYHFLNMPRTVHPKPEDYPAIYRKISTAPRFADATVLNFDFGLSLAYSYCMYQLSAHRDEFKAGADVMGDVCLKYVPDETMKSKSRRPLVSTLFVSLSSAALMTGNASAATAPKATTGTDLAAAASWSGGSGPGFPTSADVATWTTTSLGTGLTLASAASWGSISVTAAAADISVTGAGKLTLANGISAGTSANNITFANPIALSATQTWNIAASKTLTASGIVSGTTFGITKNSGTGTLNLSNIANTYTGPVSVSAGTLQFGTLTNSQTYAFTGNALTLNGVTINTTPDPDAVSVNIPASNAVGGRLFAHLKASQP